jgi:hypothetical protein
VVFDNPLGPRIRKVRHGNLPPAPVPPLSQTHPYAAATSTVSLEYMAAGGGTWNPLTTDQATVALNIAHGASNGQFDLFDTTMTALDFNSGGVMIRESPSKASLGRHTIESGGGGGGYKMASFFDVWLEISTDGGQNWLPALTPLHLELEAGQAPIPTVSQWGLIVLALLLLAAGTVVIRRQRGSLAQPVPA